MLYTHCVIADGAGRPESYGDGPYTLEELAEPEPGIDQQITIWPSGIVAVWIPQWATWEVWYNNS